MRTSVAGSWFGDLGPDMCTISLKPSGAAGSRNKGTDPRFTASLAFNPRAKTDPISIADGENRDCS
jgi:hypothetical protein